MTINKFIIFYFLLAISLTTSAQITFEPGYYINNEGQRVDGLIRNTDWVYNPVQFDFKESINAPINNIELQDIKEFGIDGGSKYIKKTVDIDKSSNDIVSLTTDRDPTFEKETVLLKVLIEGSASLYQYQEQNLIRFFYETSETDAKQLIYKRYLLTPGRIASNNNYWQQLLNEVNCLKREANEIQKTEYKRSDLIKYFTSENKCLNSDFKSYLGNTKKFDFNLNLRPGINFTDLIVENSSEKGINANFYSQTSFRIGIETELVFPFNKNKWALIFEPYYEYYNSEVSERSDNSNDPFGSVNYNTINFPLGARYYLYLSQKSSLYINLGFQYNFAINSSLYFDQNEENGLDVKAGQNLFFGLGYQFNKKYGVEFRLHTERDILSDYLLYDGNFQSAAIIISYKLF